MAQIVEEGSGASVSTRSTAAAVVVEPSKHTWLLLVLMGMIYYFATMGGELAMSRRGVTEAETKKQKASLWADGKSGGSTNNNKGSKIKAEKAKSPPEPPPPHKGVPMISRQKFIEDAVTDYSSPTAPIKLPDPPNLRAYSRTIEPKPISETPAETMISFPGPEMELALPSVWDAYKSLSSQMTVGSETDLPVFYHIPKSGGSSIKDIILNCHFKAMASEVGILDGHDQDDELHLVHIKGQTELAIHINVDVTTKEGIEKARIMGLVNSELVQIIATPLLYESAMLFDGAKNNKRGRIFAVFRHPIRRAVSMFAYLRKAYWEPTYRPDFEHWTLEHYALSDVVEDNFMTRQLARVADTEAVTEQHLDLAKAIVAQKVLVGLLDRVEDSLVRFEQYFGWRYTGNPTRQETCRNTLLVTGVNTNTDPHNQLPAEETNSYQMIKRKNNLDLLLYEFVEQLFDYQAGLVHDVPPEIRLINTTCSLCDGQ
eukprot:CAMPEP_0119018528 /NCGR_PEP_ID=MMETSP1176-20130426/19629_1 /TAXON_ID=265551 /ORGANISM="Synedropsis recta cf, Strain CCMP1620" /LENGTH=484 /DNA_ID=CAMNT_0006972551 /DNA_START=102 /DNA_END=1556 /DNA_ORIENTATION=-